MLCGLFLRFFLFWLLSSPQFLRQACFELAMLHASGTCGATFDPVACNELLAVASSLGHPLAAYHLACRKLKGTQNKKREERCCAVPNLLNVHV